MTGGTPSILCLGALHWDVIAHAARPLTRGGDVPGRISRLPGGVAFNVARALVRQGLRASLISATGSGSEGDALIAEARRAGVGVDHVLRRPDDAADRYLAIEDETGLVAAVADSRTLEAAATALLTTAVACLSDPPEALLVESNLPAATLTALSAVPELVRMDLRLLPAGPGKARRLLPLLGHPRATVYLNRAEAEEIVSHPLKDAADAARALRAAGACRVVVTDGPRAVVAASREGECSALPPQVRVARVTGAGDTFVAAHMAAELRGLPVEAALAAALAAAAHHISAPAAATGETL
ncbi:MULTISPECIES: PfkB family carbohydrate kinase [unclassified Haematobacter]|uniref:PfkB family carbohydrate kinase n=1 Tax=unclassified Haematobacter TaxID=2640585 RepID=UPI0025C2A925|nr:MULTISPECIES: PfkB family carbohydrate kinase [unclassified Haematobacter]